MRHWSICYPDENDNTVIETLSESEIISQYWDYWYSSMCKKFGKETVDANYSTLDCINDWVVVHLASEIKQ